MQNPTPRKQLSPDERRALCQQWKTSGLSRSKFCRQHGVALSSFHHWLNGKRLEGARLNLKNNQDWVPVTVKKRPDPITEEPLLLEMILPNQIRLKLTVASSKINTIIEELSHANTALR
jgi:transposase-like protein